LGIATAVLLNGAHAALADLLPDLSAEEINVIMSEPNSRLLRDMQAAMREQVIELSSVP
jgi:hypothetical protein